MSEPRTTAVLFVECQRGVDRRPLGAPGAGRGGPAGARRHGPTGRRRPRRRRAGGAPDLPAPGRTAARPASARRSCAPPRRRRAGGTPTPPLEIVPEIGVGPDDLVLPRHQGISPVHRTEVLTVLRNMGMDEHRRGRRVDEPGRPARRRGRGRRGLRRHGGDRRHGRARRPSTTRRCSGTASPSWPGSPRTDELLAEWSA